MGSILDPAGFIHALQNWTQESLISGMYNINHTTGQRYKSQKWHRRFLGRRSERLPSSFTETIYFWPEGRGGHTLNNLLSICVPRTSFFKLFFGPFVDHSNSYDLR